MKSYFEHSFGLSPSEIDFLQRRMPVDSSAAASPPPIADRPDVVAPVVPSRLAKSKIDKLCLEMGAGSMWLRAAGLESLADDVLRLAKEIGEALK